MISSTAASWGANAALYTCADDATDVDVPATVQAAIAARIDRLAPDAKLDAQRGSRYGHTVRGGLLTRHLSTSGWYPFSKAELVDQVDLHPSRGVRVSTIPLIRTVAYRSQLTSARAELHRRLAAALEERDPGSIDHNPALIAEHLEAAGNLAAAFAWHMRAGEWLRWRDIDAGRLSWQRARQVADRMPNDHAGGQAMGIDHEPCCARPPSARGPHSMNRRSKKLRSWPLLPGTRYRWRSRCSGVRSR